MKGNQASFQVVLARKSPAPSKVFRIIGKFDFSAQNIWVDVFVKLQDTKEDVTHEPALTFMTEFVNITQQNNKFVTESIYTADISQHIFDPLLYFHFLNEHSKSTSKWILAFHIYLDVIFINHMGAISTIQNLYVNKLL